MAKKNKQKKNDDFLAQNAAQDMEQAQEYTLDIPEDEIWTYQIEGLQAPHINKPFKNAGIKKVVVVITLLIAIGLSIYMSVRAVHSDEFKYNELEDGTYELVKFTNPGNVTDITIDYVVDLETGEKDTTKPITVIHEYAFNCDETLHNITFGKDVKEIDARAVYSCWNLRNVWVDDANESYCDIDGVVYTKDMTEAIHYPTAHDMQLMLENGYADESFDEDGNQIFKSTVTNNDGKLVDENGNDLVPRVWGTDNLHDEFWFQTYNKTCRTYVVPSTVTSLNDMSFAYSDIVDLYIPEGVTYLGDMAIFKNTAMVNIYTYKCDAPITDTTYKAIDQMTEIYDSLPSTLEYIGADALYYTRGLSYMYIPATVTEIKHHALWDAVYKENDELKGVSQISVERDENGFGEVSTGDQWRPQYDYMLFKKSVDLIYSAERENHFANNINRQYFWAVQWIVDHKGDDVKNASSYLVKDLDNDGIPELVLRVTEDGATTDTILTFQYDYLCEYAGEANLDNESFSALDDKAQLDSIFEMQF